MSDAEGRRHAAQVIYDEADRLRRLVEALLDLARLESGQSDMARQAVDTAAILARVADQQAIVAAGRQIQIIRDWSPDLPTLVGDGDRLAQVFINLIDNAIRHSSAAGEVRVAASVNNGWMKSASKTMDRASRLRTRDGSSSVSTNWIRRAPALEGAGPGWVWPSREIVSAHGGHIELLSSPGHGSRFTVVLPLSRPDDKTQARRR